MTVRVRSLVLCVPVAIAVVFLVLAPARSRARPSGGVPAGGDVVTVGGPTNRTIAAGFLGLSLEYWAIPAYAGSNPSRIDPVFVQLIHNLSSAPVLRIGGVTTDNSWWPVRAVTPPAGVTYTLTHRWSRITRALAASLEARLILGVNFEADSPTVAAGEARKLLAGIGRRRIAAFELGNEPELYADFNWGRSGGPGRPPGYDFAVFDRDFGRTGRALPNVPLAGPADGAPAWYQHLGRFLSDHPRVAVATLHRYPLQLCFVTAGQPNYPTIADLLSPYSSRLLADSVARAVEVAHAHRVSLRIDEMNTLSCGDVPRVDLSFASALWAVDALFEMARVGVDGVNIHTYPRVSTALFSFKRVRGRWRAVVAPEYYGLLMFAQAAPPGSRLLKVSPRAVRQLKAWATLARDGTIRVIAINKGSRPRTVVVRATAARGTGTLELLEAPGLLARNGVTLAGQSFRTPTASGLLSGPRRTIPVAPHRRAYTLRVPPWSAAMLTLASG